MMLSKEERQRLADRICDHPQLNLIISCCDGHDFHERTKEQAARDREKDRRIQAADIPILRFTGSQIHADPLDCAFEIYNFIYRRLEARKATA